VRHGGRVRRPIREDAASAGAEGGEKYAASHHACQQRNGCPTIRAVSTCFHFPTPDGLINPIFIPPPNRQIRQFRRDSHSAFCILHSALFLCPPPRSNLLVKPSQTILLTSANLDHEQSRCFMFAAPKQWIGFVPFLSAKASATADAPNCGKSMELPLHEYFTSQTGSFPIKPNQTKSKHFFTAPHQ